MSYTQAQVDALKASAAKGVRKLKLNGEEIEFPSLAEMRRQIREMEAEIAGGASGGVSVSYPVTRRGL